MVPLSYLSKDLLAIHCPSCSLLLYRLEDPIFMVPLSYLSEDMLAIHRLILPRFFLVDIDRAIYVSRWSNITVHCASL